MLFAGAGGNGPDERVEELRLDEDGRDGKLQLGADVGRPPRGLRRRLEDARDAVRLGQEGAVHGAEAHPHREPERRCVVPRYSPRHSTFHFTLNSPLDANLKLFDVLSASLASASPSSYLFAVVYTFFDHNSLRRGPNAMQAFLVSKFFVHHAILFQEKASEHL